MFSYLFSLSSFFRGLVLRSLRTILITNDVQTFLYFVP